MRLLSSTLAFVAVLLVPGLAHAHKMHSSADIGRDIITVTAYYDDDTPADRARVTIAVVEGGELVADGVLDEKGVWACPRPGPGLYVIVVESAGHRSELRFEIPDAPARLAVADGPSDRRLGIALVLAVLLGGSLAVWYFRGRAKASSPRPADRV